MTSQISEANWHARQVAYLALRDVERQRDVADVALHRWLRKLGSAPASERHLATELLYGCVRQQRTLDAIVDRLAKKPASQQPPDLRIILHIGLYQLRYLDRIPPSAAVNTTVDLAKANGLKGLAGFVNGFLRQYLRSPSEEFIPAEVAPVTRLGVQYSLPDWIVARWCDRLGLVETEQLCAWMNRSPRMDLRVNPLRASLEQVMAALQAANIAADRVAIADNVLPLPQALRLGEGAGAIADLPGYDEGWWTVQDSSAQLVTHLLDPQPGETVIDACAAPGGKTTHIAERMGDRGTIWACVKTGTKKATHRRLQPLQQNLQRLDLHSVCVWLGDSRQNPDFRHRGDRVLVDAPCSGLGTLHRRADARWRQSPENLTALATLQQELLAHTATWVKPGGVLVYATCTLNPQENQEVIKAFLRDRPEWRIDLPGSSLFAPFLHPEGWLEVLPHRHDMDGFFMVRLVNSKEKILE